MIKNIFDESGDRLVRAVDSDPRCGEDFCDRCGDCLHCYPDHCVDGDAHYWVQHGEDPPHVHEWNPIGNYCIGCGEKNI